MILFVTIACGAVSDFHALVSSGTAAKQIKNEKHMLPVSFGAMLLESLLAVTLTALGMTIATKFGGVFAGTTANLGGDLLQGCFAVALFALGVMVAVQGIRKLWGKNAEQN